MKVAVVFVLLFATVLCRPARRGSPSSSESSEEVMRRPAARVMKKMAELVQDVVAAATGQSDESKEEAAAAVEDFAPMVKSGAADTTAATDTVSVDSQDSEDEDDDDEDDDTEEADTDEEEDDTSESGESSSPAPTTLDPVVVVTDEPAVDTTDGLEPTVVTDTDGGRGDSLGGNPSDYKSYVYVEDKSYHKVPAPYKSYEYVDTGKKSAYGMTDGGNEVDKTLKVYKVKALQVHHDLLEEDTSTPEVESQGLLDPAQDQDATLRQASLPGEEEGQGATTSESGATTSESQDDSLSAESEADESQSSEEATATPGAADSQSDESHESESEEGGAPIDATTDEPMVITAK